MKINITLDPQELETAIEDYLKKNENLSKVEFYVVSIDCPRGRKQGLIAPDTEISIELGIPF